MKHMNLKMGADIKRRDDEEKFDYLVDINDEILERIVSSLCLFTCTMYYDQLYRCTAIELKEKYLNCFCWFFLLNFAWFYAFSLL